jgi:hypothetical protein
MRAKLPSRRLVSAIPMSSLALISRSGRKPIDIFTEHKPFTSMPPTWVSETSSARYRLRQRGVRTSERRRPPRLPRRTSLKCTTATAASCRWSPPSSLKRLSYGLKRLGMWSKTSPNSCTGGGGCSTECRPVSPHLYVSCRPRSLSYCARIRAGACVPGKKHWETFRHVVRELSE